MLLLLFFGTVLLKWILFPTGMKPGIYAVYGWTYLRWLAFNCIYRRTALFLQPHIGCTAAWSLWFRLMGSKIGNGCVIDTWHIYEPDLIAIGNNTTVDELAFITAAMVVPPGVVDNGKPWSRIRCCRFYSIVCLLALAIQNRKPRYLCLHQQRKHHSLRSWNHSETLHFNVQWRV